MRSFGDTTINSSSLAEQVKLVDMEVLTHLPFRIQDMGEVKYEETTDGSFVERLETPWVRLKVIFLHMKLTLHVCEKLK